MLEKYIETYKVLLELLNRLVEFFLFLQRLHWQKKPMTEQALLGTNLAHIILSYGTVSALELAQRHSPNLKS
jgi:hypothetical protein